MPSRLCSLIMLICFCSACHNSRKDPLIDSVQQSMERSILTVNNMSQISLNSLREKISDPRSSGKAREWLPKADLVELRSREITAYVEKLTGVQKNGKALHQKINEYANAILSIHPMINETFKREFTDSLIPRNYNPSLWKILALFDDADAQKQAMLLSQLRLAIAERNNDLIRFCNDQASLGCVLSFETFSAIIGQNSQALLPGEKLDITAGIGAFSTRAQPRVTVNGHQQPIASDGVTRYSFTPTGKPGEYQVPVVIDFVDQDGVERSILKNLSYRLLRPQ